MKLNSEQDKILERLLGPLWTRPKYRLFVRRVEPKYCAKYLGTMDIDDGEQFSFNTFRDIFGGGKFYIKVKDGYGNYIGHRTVTICADVRL